MDRIEFGLHKNRLQQRSNHRKCIQGQHSQSHVGEFQCIEIGDPMPCHKQGADDQWNVSLDVMNLERNLFISTKCVEKYHGKSRTKPDDDFRGHGNVFTQDTRSTNE